MSSRILRRSTAVALALALGACAVKRDTYDTPAVPLPEAYLQAGDAAAPPTPATAEDDQTLPKDLSRWWTRFGSPELNALVERALAHNWQVQAAVARLAQAEAAFKNTQAAELPTLDGYANATADAPAGGIGSVGRGQDITSDRSFEVGLQAAYEVDLWGANRAASVAAWEQSRATAYERQVVAWTLTADVVAAYFEVLSLQERVETARGTLRIMRQLQDAVRQRMEGGEADALELAQQRTAVARAAAVIPVLSLQRDQALHALALLVGTAPGQLHLDGGTLAAIDYPTVAPGLPSTLLLRRPDVLQAEHQLLAADADIDVARAAFLPTFSLTGQGGYGSNYLSTLLRPESLIWNLAADVVVSIFDGGANEAALAEARARHRELVATYMQTSFNALREVEDALSSVRYISERLAAQREAVAAARESYDLSRQAYAIGTIDYLTLLDTERTLFDTEDTLHQVELARAQASIDLFKALGGDTDAQETSGATAPEAAEG